MIKILKSSKIDTTLPVSTFVMNQLIKHDDVARYQSMSLDKLTYRLAQDFKMSMDRVLFDRCDWKQVAMRVIDYETN